MVFGLQFSSLLLTCEHASRRVPREYRGLFRGAEEVLKSHRGWDIGILPVAREVARKMGRGLHTGGATRLLVDLNRSPGHRDLFSSYVSPLDADARQKLLRDHYLPYRQAVEEKVKRMAQAGKPVLHLSFHSFTPELKGQVRRADMGLLYETRRRACVDAALRWKAYLEAAAPDLRIRRNYPYTGRLDGLIPYLLRRFGERHYAGVEIEINQAQLTGHRRLRMRALQTVVESVDALWREFGRDA